MDAIGWLGSSGREVVIAQSVKQSEKMKDIETLREFLKGRYVGMRVWEAFERIEAVIEAAQRCDARAGTNAWRTWQADMAELHDALSKLEGTK